LAAVEGVDMLRRAGVMVLSAGLAFAGLASADVAFAYGKKAVVANGSIACDWAAGTITFKPKLVNGGTTPGQVKFKGTLGNCRDDSGENGPVPFGITGAKVTGSFSIPTNACTSEALATGGAGRARIKWTAPQKLVPTEFTSTDSGYQFDADSNSFSFPADYQHQSGSVTGSFSGPAGLTASQLFGTSDEFGAPIELACTPKTKGVKGSGGLRKLALNPSLALLFTSPAVPAG
jgi:hypothetical protein